MTKSHMGYIDAAFMFAYAIGNFFWGMFGDRAGTRHVIIIGMFGSILAALAVGVSKMVLIIGVLMFIQGLCQSSGWAPLAKNIANWFSQKERGVIMGWWSTNYAVGGAVAAPFAALCAVHLSPWVRSILDTDAWTVLQQNWRFAFIGPAGALFAVFILFILLQKNTPADVSLPAIEKYHNEPETILEKGDRPEEEIEGTWKLILKVLKNRNVLFLSLVYALLKPTRYLMILWGPLYINDKLGTGVVDSTILSTPFEIAGVIAILTAGYVSDKLFRSRRMPYSVICLFLLALVLFFFDGLITFTQSRLAVVFLLCAVGFLMYGPEALLSATAPLDFGTKKGASTASGMVNAVGSVTSAVVSTFGAAWVIQRWSWNVLFIILGCITMMLVLLLLPKWNALPLTAEKTNNGK